MLNYIWAGLIIISILFALGHDIQDELNNTYDNGNIHAVSYSFDQHSTSLELKLPDKSIIIPLQSSQLPEILKIPINKALPDEWQTIASHQHKDKQSFKARIVKHDIDKHTLHLLFPEVHWVKLRAIIDAAFDMSKFAVQLAIGLAGIMALWLGLMKIAEQSGLIHLFVKAIHPLLHWLFPEVPKNHPALGSIGLNLSANIMGLGNAATPLGIKAMQQLQSLNQDSEKASNAMCMFLALNTSSVQLLPPVTLIALMGSQVSELIIPIILATSCSTIVAIIFAKHYASRNKG